MRQAAPRRSTDVDAHVGARIRARRRLLGMTQEQLADALGITFQQVQKYERGTNRVSASKLFETARALSTPMVYFFEGLGDYDREAPLDERELMSARFFMSDEGVQLAADFPRITNKRIRKRLLELVRTLAGQDEPQNPD
jgi:transcriptional regulator with XRE-family HTH domain